MNINTFKSFVDFIPLAIPIEFKGFTAVGYFPYEKAQLHHDCVCTSRNLYDELERALHPIMDNKIVVVFEDNTRFNTNDFAVQFKDAYCKVGRLDQVMGYACRELKQNVVQ